MSTSSTSKRVYDPTCEKCTTLRLGRFEWYEFKTKGGESYAWNISEAHRLVNTRCEAFMRGDAPVPTVLPIPLEAAQEILASNEILPRHVAHVDPSAPGLAVTRTLDGQEVTILIDGNHRLARCVQEGQVFHVVLLTAEEEEQVRLSHWDIVKLTRLYEEMVAILGSAEASNEKSA